MPKSKLKEFNFDEFKEEYIESQLEGVDLDRAIVQFRSISGNTKWLNWEDVLNYLIKKGIGE